MKKIYCPRCGAQFICDDEDGFIPCPECGCGIELDDESEKVIAGALRFLAPEKKLDVSNEITRKMLNITGSIPDDDFERVRAEAEELARKYHPE